MKFEIRCKIHIIFDKYLVSTIFAHTNKFKSYCTFSIITNRLNNKHGKKFCAWHFFINHCSSSKNYYAQINWMYDNQMRKLYTYKNIITCNFVSIFSYWQWDKYGYLLPPSDDAGHRTIFKLYLNISNQLLRTSRFFVMNTKIFYLFIMHNWNIVNMKIFYKEYKCIKCTCTYKKTFFRKSYLLLKVYYLTINKYTNYTKL